MATESIEVSGVVHASPERIYQAWLSSSEHSAMTGRQAMVEGNVGGRFTAYDGRIEGAMVELEPGRRIVQRWRSSDFPSDAEDSLLEVRLEPIDNGTRVAFVHTEIPEGQATQLEEGWRRDYLEPMDRYFVATFGEEEGGAEEPVAEEEIEAPEPKRPAKKAAPKKTAASKARPAAKKSRVAAKAAPRRAAKKAAKSRRRASKGSAKKAKAKGKAKRSSRRGKR